MEKTSVRTLRADLSPAERERAERIGRIEFRSAGAIRKQQEKQDGTERTDPAS